jgi:MFS family permease
VNAAPALFGLLSAWAADPVNQLLGRRGTIFATNLFVVFPVLAQGFTHSWADLLICRLFMGLGMGIKISTIPIYSAEVSPAAIRGAIVTSFQLYVAFGILVGFSSNLIFMNIGPLAWRFQLAAAFVPAVPLMALIWLCPESPRWLMKKGRYQKAFRAFNRIRNTELISARELFYAHCQIEAESEVFGGKSLGRRVRELFTVPRIRRATVSSSIIVIAQQFSGMFEELRGWKRGQRANTLRQVSISWPSTGMPSIDTREPPMYHLLTLEHSATIFEEAGYTVKQSLLASFGFVNGSDVAVPEYLC